MIVAPPDAELDVQKAQEATGTDLGDEAYEQWMDEYHRGGGNGEETPGHSAVTGGAAPACVGPGPDAASGAPAAPGRRRGTG